MNTVTYKYKDKLDHSVTVTTKADFDKVAQDITTPARYPFAVRKEVSKQLLGMVEQFTPSEETVKSLEKTAGWATSTPGHVYDALRNRSLLLQRDNAEIAVKLQKVADALVEKYATVIPHAVLDKTASFVDVIDRATNLHTYYDKGLNRPEDDIYRYTISDGKRLKKYAVNLKNDTVLSSNEIENNFDHIKGVMEDAFDIKVKNVKEAVDELAGLNSKQADILIKAAF